MRRQNVGILANPATHGPGVIFLFFRGAVASLGNLSTDPAQRLQRVTKARDSLTWVVSAFHDAKTARDKAQENLAEFVEERFAQQQQIKT